MVRLLSVFLIFLICTCVHTHARAAEAGLKLQSEKKIEFHGMYNGQQFWLRLLPANKQYGGLRVLEILYTPKGRDALGGAVMVDHPQILVDANLNIRAWKEGRGVHHSGHGGIMYQGTGYLVNREIDDKNGNPEIDERKVTHVPAWDKEIAPMLLGLCKLDQTLKVPVLDFYGATFDKPTQLNLNKAGYKLSDKQFTVKKDEKGKLKQVLDAKGKVVFEIKGWL